MVKSINYSLYLLKIEPRRLKLKFSQRVKDRLLLTLNFCYDLFHANFEQLPQCNIIKHGRNLLKQFILKTSRSTQTSIKLCDKLLEAR